MSVRRVDSLAPAAERSMRTRRRRLAAACSLIVVAALVAVVALERADAIVEREGRSSTGPLPIGRGSVFALYFGLYSASENLRLGDVTPMLPDGLVIEDVRVFLGPGSTPASELPHGCAPISYPGAPALGRARAVAGLRVPEGAWFNVVAYVRAEREGSFSTAVPVRFGYEQVGLWQQRQVLSHGELEVKLEVSDDAKRLDWCRVA